MANHSIGEEVSGEIVDYLMDFDLDGTVGRGGKIDWFDARIDEGPLAGPIGADAFARVDVAAIHAIGPGDVGIESGEDALDVARVEAIIKVLEEFYFVRQMFRAPIRFYVAWPEGEAATGLWGFL